MSRAPGGARQHRLAAARPCPRRAGGAGQPRSDVVLLVVLAVGRGPPRRRVLDGEGGLVALGAGAAADEAAPEEQQGRGRPADVKRGPHLPLLGRRHRGVVEVPDDDVGEPAERDEDQDPAEDVDGSAGDHDAGLHLAGLDAVGALRAHHGHHQRHQPQQSHDDRERPPSLHLGWQRQDGVVHLALHLPCALHHTVHPQPFPDGLRHHDVHVDEGRHLPHGQPAGQDHPHPAQDAQSQPQNLHRRRSHGAAAAPAEPPEKGRRGRSAPLAPGQLPSRLGAPPPGSAI